MNVTDFKRKFHVDPDARIVRDDILMCPVCINHPANIDIIFGIMACDECKARQARDRSGLGRLGGYPEFTTQKIRDEREQYGADQVQSHRGGEFSREFAEIYPERTKELIKNGVVTRDEVKKSRPVWKGDIKHLDKHRKIDADVI